MAFSQLETYLGSANRGNKPSPGHLQTGDRKETGPDLPPRGSEFTVRKKSPPHPTFTHPEGSHCPHPALHHRNVTIRAPCVSEGSGPGFRPALWLRLPMKPAWWGWLPVWGVQGCCWGRHGCAVPVDKMLMRASCLVLLVSCEVRPLFRGACLERTAQQGIERPGFAALVRGGGFHLSGVIAACHFCSLK